jgi:N-succinyldiaminopimelate aminotransferase
VARFPDVSAAGAAVPASIFARLREHLARFRGDVIPLQIGDTHLPPAAALHAIAWDELPPGELYAYGAPGGWAPLVDALAARHAVSAGAVQITCGATQALSSAVHALCDPGDELVLCAPHWPLIRGIALGHGVVPVTVPIFDQAAPPFGGAAGQARVPASARFDIATLDAAITPRASAIYFATPNNPTGGMLAPDQLAQLAELAQRRHLWILADEVYEHYAYDGVHASIAKLASARTVSVYSFAKSYAQAGLRVGYAIAPEPIAATIRKLVNHAVYNVPVAMQRAALVALLGGSRFLDDARARYRAARDRALAKLRATAACPPGGAYLWLDLRALSGDDCMPVLERIAEAGVLLAPGSAFGTTCGGFARLCFTGVSEERLDEGIDRINRVLAGWA